MAKILTDKEVSDIVVGILAGLEEFDDCSQQLEFLKDITEVLTKHCGGRCGIVEYTEDMESYTAAVHVNNQVPSDGGIWKDYDIDVTWKDGKET